MFIIFFSGINFLHLSLNWSSDFGMGGALKVNHMHPLKVEHLLMIFCGQQQGNHIVVAFKRKKKKKNIQKQEYFTCSSHHQHANHFCFYNIVSLVWVYYFRFA